LFGRLGHFLSSEPGRDPAFERSQVLVHEGGFFFFYESRIAQEEPGHTNDLPECALFDRTDIVLAMTAKGQKGGHKDRISVTLIVNTVDRIHFRLPNCRQNLT
jgi:hypothetical protein